MVKFSAVCLFCEDIREEKSGQDTLVGTLPDTLNLDGPPLPASAKTVMLPKIGFYFRINFNAQDEKPQLASARIENPSGTTIVHGEWDASLIDKAFNDAKANQLPFAGLLLKIVAGPIAMALGEGKMVATVTIDGTDHVIGALKVVTPSVSSQPVSQSPPAS